MQKLTAPINTIRPRFTLHARDYLLELGQKTKLMGIINLTPDSFSFDGCFKDQASGHIIALNQANKMIEDGADIIDIGGESSRPGSKQISSQEEINRIIPTIQTLAKQIKAPISVDTYKPIVAKHALDAGASIINNIEGGEPDPDLLKMIRDYDAAIVLMHMQGTPHTMQQSIHYGNLINEIYNSLRNSVENCLEIGIKSDKIIVDPGIGFGKTVEHNLEILNRLKDFQEINQPILIGTSRKSFIGNVLRKEVQDRILGTASTVCASILKGAHIIRVHDVAEMKEVATMTDAILNMSH